MMKHLPLLLWFALQAPAADRVWYFPALPYGPDRWSLLKIVNNDRQPQDVKLDVFDEQGAPIAIESPVHLKAGETREIRIEKDSKRSEFCWARLEAAKKGASKLTVEAATERLMGNVIERFTRRNEEPSTRQSWYTSPGEFQFIYLVNVDDKPLKATVCWAERPSKNSCDEPAAAAGRNRVTLQAKQTLYARLSKKQFAYMVVELSKDPRVIATFLGPGQGERREFSTNTTLSFDNVEDPERH